MFKIHNPLSIWASLQSGKKKRNYLSDTQVNKLNYLEDKRCNYVLRFKRSIIFIYYFLSLT